MKTLNVEKILDKGLQDEDSLTQDEKLIYVVAYFESISDMEGWDHFFTYSMEWYPLLTKILKLAGDFSSTKIIRDYKIHLKELGVAFNAQDIDTFFTNVPNEYYIFCVDWREKFSNSTEQRWQLIVRYFKTLNIRLET